MATVHGFAEMAARDLELLENLNELGLSDIADELGKNSSVVLRDARMSAANGW